MPPHGEDYEHRSEHEHAADEALARRIFERWEGVINAAIAWYVCAAGAA